MVIKAGFTEEVIFDIGLAGWLRVHANNRVRPKGAHVNNLRDRVRELHRKKQQLLWARPKCLPPPALLFLTCHRHIISLSLISV